MNSFSFFKNRPLSRKLVFSVVIFSSAIALFITIFQLYAEYKTDVELIRSDLDSIESVHLDSLTQLVWTSDTLDLNKQLNGILSKPAVKYIKVVDADGTITAVGEEQTDHFIEKSINLYKSYKGKQEKIATLYIQSTLSQVYDKLLLKATYTLLLNAIKTLLVSALILFLIHNLFTKHLNSIADYLSDFNISKISKKYSLNRKKHSIDEKDEIDIVVEGITAMQENLRVAIDQLHENNARFKRLVESSQAIPWEYDVASGKISYIGPQVEFVFGISNPSNANLYNQEFWIERLHPLDRDAVIAEFKEKIKTRSEFTLEYRMLDVNDEVLWIRNFIQVISNKDGIDHLRGFMINFTEQKHVEREKEKSHLRLENLVHERTKDLEDTIKELEAFSYSVSHDLRAPLRAIEGYSTILSDDYANKLDKEAIQYLGRIRAGCHKMSDLIDALLNLSKNSVKSMQIQTVNLSDICQDIVKRIGDDDSDRNVSVDIQPDIIVNADAMSMTILFENLIGNAWKYTRQRKKAYISFGVINRSGNDPVYFVKDNGIGFEKKFAKHLFSPFQRLYNSEGFEGTGIGLATAHRIITRHRGKIWAESAPDEGTTFYFTLNDSGILSNIIKGTGEKLA